MAEASTENLTTEQILSSIREILLDEDKRIRPEKEIKATKKEDILDLTQAMVVKHSVEIPKPLNSKKEPDVKVEAKPQAVLKPDFNSEDVAKNIIKSFAKNFSNLSNDAKKDYLSRNNTSEDSLLRASISTAVEDWVFKNIKADFELQRILRDEVAKQVNVWFDANLVKLVNSSIKQEMERVMVKVDEVQ